METSKEQQAWLDEQGLPLGALVTIRAGGGGQVVGARLATVLVANAQGTWALAPGELSRVEGAASQPVALTDDDAEIAIHALRKYAGDYTDQEAYEVANRLESQRTRGANSDARTRALGGFRLEEGRDR